MRWVKLEIENGIWRYRVVVVFGERREWSFYSFKIDMEWSEEEEGGRGDLIKCKVGEFKCWNWRERGEGFFLFKMVFSVF